MKIKGIFILFFVLSFLKVDAQNYKVLSDPSIFQKKLKEKSLATSSIRAEFSEEKNMAAFKEPHKSTGVFYYKKANKMRWEKIQPQKYVFIVNADKVRISENGKEKDVSSFNEGVGKIKDLMLVLVNGEFQNYKAFSAEYLQDEKTYLVHLTPVNKRLAKIFDSIDLVFSKENMQLREMRFLEKSGDKNTMKFHNEAMNENLPDKLFTDF